MDAPAAKDTLAPVPVEILFAAVAVVAVDVSRMVAVVLPALTRVNLRPSAPPAIESMV